MNVLADDSRTKVRASRAVRLGLGLVSLAIGVGALAGCTAGPSANATPTRAVDSAQPQADRSPSPVKCEPNYREPRDRGPREFATGKPILNSSGRLVAYTVAPGDTDTAVADRFCLSYDALDDLNSVRQCLGAVLEPGDVFNLDPNATDTVGSRGGRVCHNVQP